MEHEFTVVTNIDHQLSLWPLGRPMCDGWRSTGFQGTRQACLDHIAGTASNAVDAAPETTLTQMFADRARRFADRVALSDGTRRLTYAELAACASRLADLLRAAGIGPGAKVAICLSRSADVVVAMLGILEAGAAYVAIDDHYPDARRDLMISRSGAELVLTGAGHADRFATVGEHVRKLEWSSQAPATTPEAPAARGESGPCGDAAAVLFTSGSSGEPKAVVLRHAGLVAFATNRVFATLGPRDRVAHVSSLSFDAVHFEVWCTFAAGAELVVLPLLSDLLGNDVQRELRRHRITAMLAPTMAVNQLVREDRDTFSALRLLYTGGDVLARQTCVDLLAGAFDGRFVNLYGPTEATTACTAYEVREPGAFGEPVPIGVPFQGATVTLRAADLTTVPDGQVGEIHVGGVGVAGGYLGQPALTADRFVPDPDGTPGSRMYATGDLGRMRPDGMIEFCGRLDDQTKIRGFRVELGEVEQAFLGHPAIRETAVLVTGSGDNRALVLFALPQEPTTPAELRAFATERLPEHMVPHVVIVLDTMPSTENGKRDRAQLAALWQEHKARQARYIAPTTETERYLTSLWANLLALEPISTNDDFFELGGHSLLAFRAQRRIQRDLGVELDFAELLDHSRLDDLAELITHRSGVA